MTHDFEDGTFGDSGAQVPWAPSATSATSSPVWATPISASPTRTPQITFIDDGVVQPATGGSFATSDNRKYAWGYVVNYTGGSEPSATSAS